MGNTLTTSFLGYNFSRKRKFASSRDASKETVELDDDIHTPKRRKITSTAKYIYKILFEEGKDSDVKIIALNKSWNLHKIYLSQSPYFSSMFSGTWIETKQKEIYIGIEDENITVEALNKVLGALYQDEIQISPEEAVSVLGCATLLQLDDIINQTVEVMRESIYLETVLQFYSAAELYGVNDIKVSTMNWLLVNLSTKITESPEYLRQISCDLMAELISSPQLIVIQTEFSLYLLLKQWLFLKLNVDWRGDNISCQNFSQIYYKETAGDTPFLSTNEGKSYEKAFCSLRLQHLVVHHLDVEVIEKDHIIPRDWFAPIFKSQWCHMLRIAQGVDRGPRKVTMEEFNKHCFRCGRILQSNTQYTWRWTGFNFGLDLVVAYADRTFSFRRYRKQMNDQHATHRNNNIQDSSPPRHFVYRLFSYSLDKKGKVIYASSTKTKTISLVEDEQIPVLSIPREACFPLIVSASFLLTTPSPDFILS